MLFPLTIYLETKCLKNVKTPFCNFMVLSEKFRLVLVLFSQVFPCFILARTYRKAHRSHRQTPWALRKASAQSGLQSRSLVLPRITPHK